MATSTDQLGERLRAAAGMYVYGFPLVYNLREIAGFVGRAPATFRSARRGTRSATRAS